MHDNLKIASTHVKKIINSGIDNLNDKLMIIERLDKFIQKISETMQDYQSGSHKRILLRIEDGYWYFYKQIAIPHTNLAKKKPDSLDFIIRHKRLTLMYVDKSLDDIRHVNVRDLIITSKKYIQMRNHLVKKIATSLGGIKKLKTESELSSEITKMLKRIPKVDKDI